MCPPYRLCRSDKRVPFQLHIHTHSFIVAQDAGLLIAALLVASLVADNSSGRKTAAPAADDVDQQTHAVLKRSFGSTWSGGLANGNWNANGAGGGSGWSSGLGEFSGGGALDSWNG